MDPLLRHPDRRHTYCVRDAPTPEAVRRVADRNDLPVDRITEVRVLDLYFYRRDRCYRSGLSRSRSTLFPSSSGETDRDPVFRR